MANSIKLDFLSELEERFGKLDKLPHSQSLFQLHGQSVRIYVRYSKSHPGRRTFFGLRETDLRQLVGFESFVAFLWDDQDEPLFSPFPDYHELFQETVPASDGQYKVQILRTERETIEIYIAPLGRFNVSGHVGWRQLAEGIAKTTGTHLPVLSHSQVQTLLGAIGVVSGHDVWIPANDRQRLDWQIARKYDTRPTPPLGFKGVDHIVAESMSFGFRGEQTNRQRYSKLSTQPRSTLACYDSMIFIWSCAPYIQHSA